MRNSIIVNVSELRSFIQDIRRTGSDFVKIEIHDEETFDDEVLPPCVTFESCKNSDTHTWIDSSEPLVAVENESELDKYNLDGIHMSDNMC